MDDIRPSTTAEGVEHAIQCIASTQYGAFGRAQAMAAGATNSHLKHGIARGRYRRLERGVFAVAAAPDSWRLRLIGACLARPAYTCASHRAAAHLWAMGIDRAPIEVSTTADVRPRTEELIVHRVTALPACDRALKAQIPTTSPARTLIDLAAVVDAETLEVALDEALRRGLASLARVRWRLQELGTKGRKGTASLLGLLNERSKDARSPESPLETRVRRAIRNAGLPEPIASTRFNPEACLSRGWISRTR